MLRALRAIGQYGLMALGTLGRSGMIWWQAIAARPRLRNALVIKQIYHLGVLSLVMFNF